MLDRLADLATPKVLAVYLVVLAVIELVLREALGPGDQWMLNLAGLFIAISLLAIGSAPILQTHLERRRDE